MARKPKILRRFDIVEVVWLDTEQEQDWTDYASYEPKRPPSITSVGFLYSLEEHHVEVFQSMDSSVLTRGSGVFDSLLKIPKCSIEEIRIIKPYKTNTSHEFKYRWSSTG